MDDFWRKISGIYPTGVPIAQSWLDLGAILSIIQAEDVRFVFEVGVHRGGLAGVLMNIIHPKLQYAGVEINSALIDEYLPKGNWRIGDAWSEEIVNWVREMLGRTEGRAFILCDGGNKVKDLETYVPLLRNGDLIGAHDYLVEIKPDDLNQFWGRLSNYRPSYLNDTNWIVMRKEL